MNDFERVTQNDALLREILYRGGTLEDCIVAMAKQKADLIEKIAELELICPRKIGLPDGRVFIYRCPDDNIPLVKMATCAP